MLAMTTTIVPARAPVRAPRAAALSSRVAAPLAPRSLSGPNPGRTPTLVTAAGPEEFSSAPAPSLDAAPTPGGMSKTQAAKLAAKQAKKAAKKPKKAQMQKPKRRKAPSGEKKVEMPPTEAELAASAKYDAMLEEGAIVYECFIRAKGPNQWFPVGPMAVKQDWMIVPEMWKAEDAMKKAGFKMYPALMRAPCFGNVEYGYRARDDEKKVTEEQIREAKGKLNPFEDVVLLEKPADGSAGPPSMGIMDRLNKWMNPYGTGKGESK